MAFAVSRTSHFDRSFLSFLWGSSRGQRLLCLGKLVFMEDLRRRELMWKTFFVALMVSLVLLIYDVSWWLLPWMPSLIDTQARPEIKGYTRQVVWAGVSSDVATLIYFGPLFACSLYMWIKVTAADNELRSPESRWPSYAGFSWNLNMVEVLTFVRFVGVSCSACWALGSFPKIPSAYLLAASVVHGVAVVAMLLAAVYSLRSLRSIGQIA